MNSKLTLLLLVSFTFLEVERCLVVAFVRRISKPSIYKSNEKIRSRIPDEPLIRQYTDCGGKVTKGPGTLEQFFVSRNPMHNVHCTWTIHAPEDHHVYIKQLRITHTTLSNSDDDKFDDAPFVQIFDGTEVTDGNRLFRFGDATLNKCLSSGRDLIVDLRYDESGKHIDYEAVIKYGFIKTSEVEDLLP